MNPLGTNLTESLSETIFSFLRSFELSVSSEQTYRATLTHKVSDSSHKRMWFVRMDTVTFWVSNSSHFVSRMNGVCSCLGWHFVDPGGKWLFHSVKYNTTQHVTSSIWEQIAIEQNEWVITYSTRKKIRGRTKYIWISKKLWIVLMDVNYSNIKEWQLKIYFSSIYA